MERKKHLVIWGMVILAAIGFLVGRQVIMNRSSSDFSNDPEPSSEALRGDIDPTYLSPANNAQNGSTVWLGAWSGRLFVAPTYRGLTHKETGLLFSLSGGTVSKAARLFEDGSAEYLGCAGSFLYYWHYSTGHGEVILCCCNLDSGQVTELYSAHFAGGRDAVFAEDGSVFIPLALDAGQEERFLHVYEDEILETVPFEKSYLLGDRRYSVHAASAPGERILCTASDGSVDELDLAPGDHRRILPADSGLLIHNEGRQVLLYFIDRDGRCSELFSVPCSLSDSAVTVYHDTVYISVRRYAEGSSSGKGFVGYEDDTLSGTYRINLADQSAERISDQIYTGMYIFDDSGIYACDKDFVIYKLDFSGNVLGFMAWPG